MKFELILTKIELILSKNWVNSEVILNLILNEIWVKYWVKYESYFWVNFEELMS